MITSSFDPFYRYSLPKFAVTLTHLHFLVLPFYCRDSNGQNKQTFKCRNLQKKNAKHITSEKKIKKNNRQSQKYQYIDIDDVQHRHIKMEAGLVEITRPAPQTYTLYLTKLLH